LELMPLDRWGNILQDLLLRDGDSREAVFRYRMVPVSIAPDQLAGIAVSILQDHELMRLNMGREWCRHERPEVRSIARRRDALCT